MTRLRNENNGKLSPLFFPFCSVFLLFPPQEAWCVTRGLKNWLWPLNVPYFWPANKMDTAKKKTFLVPCMICVAPSHPIPLSVNHVQCDEVLKKNCYTSKEVGGRENLHKKGVNPLLFGVVKWKIWCHGLVDNNGGCSNCLNWGEEWNTNYETAIDFCDLLKLCLDIYFFCWYPILLKLRGT